MKPFEIFRTGRHTSSQGAALSFSDGDLVAIASGYDPQLHHAPIVVGHPKDDHPAYGWVDGLEAKGGRLIAKPGSMDAAFTDLVRDGKFRARSAAFYPPQHPNNPTPGAYYLRHVGFLGAAAPAVKGLKAVEFADDGLAIVEFAESEWRQIWAIEAAGRLFRGVRDWLIETKDLETANRVLPEWDVGQLAQVAADLRAEERKSVPVYADTNTKDDDMTAANQELEARAADLARREAAFAERTREARKAEDAAFVDGVVRAGRLPVGLQATATALFADLGDDELTFAEGDQETKTTPRAAFRSLLEKLPVPVATGELTPRDEGPNFSDAGDVAKAITAEITAAAAKGEALSPADAAMRLKNRS